MNTSATPASFTGRHMLFIMVAFFATVFAANFSLVYFASHSWTGLVVENSYVASQAFDATTRKLEQAAAGIHVIEKYSGGKLTVTLTGEDGAIANASNVVVSLGRPSHESEDRTIELAPSSGGAFAAEVKLDAGIWSGVVSAEVPKRGTWQRPIRLVVRD